MARFFKVTLAYLVVLTLVGLPILLKVCLLPLWQDRPQPGTFSLAMLAEDTVYSPAYSESRFLGLRLGMYKSEVVGVLGEPIGIVRRARGRIVEKMTWVDGSWETTYKTETSGALPLQLDSETYHYTRPGDYSDYWYVRAVTFSPSGQVIRIRRIFYED